MLAKTDAPRSERRKLLKALTGGKPGAAAIPEGMPGATDEINPENIAQLKNALAAFGK